VVGGEFIVVAPSERGKGTARALIANMLKDMSVSRGRKVDTLIFEVENPAAFTGKERDAANKRLGIYQKFNAKAIDSDYFTYVQPPLEDGKNPLDNLMLCMIQTKDAATISRTTLETYLYDAFENAFGIENVADNEHYKQNVASIKSDQVPLVPVISKQVGPKPQVTL